MSFDHIIRENITPRGDGNSVLVIALSLTTILLIRENITPRGDGNLLSVVCTSKTLTNVIRENITPRGDGNYGIPKKWRAKQKEDKREYNSERRRKRKKIIGYLKYLVFPK